MDSYLDTYIKSDMQDHFKNLLFALQEGNTAYGYFLGALSTFNNTIRTHRDKLRADTLVAVNNFASLINNIVQDTLELQTTTKQSIEDSQSDISELLSSKLSKLTVTDSQDTNSSNGHPAYTRPSYEWLLSNLHNPYPSKGIKKEIADGTKCSVKDIDAWFVDVRKRIGWNKLRKTRFSNKQEKIIAAATHVLKPRPSSYTDDLSTSLISEMDSKDNYRAEFLVIAKNARSLYSDRFPDLGKSSSIEIRLQLEITLNKKMLNDIHPSSYQPTSIQHIVPYPTPEPSPSDNSTGPSPPSTPRPSFELLPSSTGKRRQLSVEVDQEDSVPRPSKRLRTDADRIDDATIRLSPFAPLTSGVDTNRATSSTSHLPANEIADVSNSKRKRRLSDSGAQGPAKRPQNALSRPRLQAVSDPLPVQKTVVDSYFDGCFQRSLEFENDLSDAIPSPATTIDRSLSTSPLNVELYQYHFSPHNPLFHLPGTSAADLEKSEAETLLSSSVSSSSSSSSFGPLPYDNAIQDSGFDFIIPSCLQFDLDSPSSYQLDMRIENAGISDDFALFSNSELLSLAPGYIPDLSPIPGDAYETLSSFDSDPFLNLKTPVLGNFNHTSRQHIPHSEDKKAKTARAQAIREELAQLMAEGL